MPRHLLEEYLKNLVVDVVIVIKLRVSNLFSMCSIIFQWQASGWAVQNLSQTKNMSLWITRQLEFKPKNHHNNGLSCRLCVYVSQVAWIFSETTLKKWILCALLNMLTVVVQKKEKRMMIIVIFITRFNVKIRTVENMGKDEKLPVDFYLFQNVTIIKINVRVHDTIYSFFLLSLVW